MNIEDLSEEEIEERLKRLKEHLLTLSKRAEQVAIEREPSDSSVYEAAQAQANFIQEVAQVEFVLEKGSPDEKEAIMHSTTKNIETIYDGLSSDVRESIEPDSEFIITE